jgi:hypothetical protein
MFDLVNNELGHQTVRDELDPSFVHLREKQLAVGVDEAHVREIYERRQWTLAGNCALPAFFEFRNTAARKSPFDKETDIAINDSRCDS